MQNNSVIPQNSSTNLKRKQNIKLSENCSYKSCQFEYLRRLTIISTGFAITKDIDGLPCYMG